ncbi:MAG TPA: GGDEF domain-containing protein [Pirellulales bacterium]|nr:GGDEF domain-containing protein [Pirellulales bacterium]
MVLFVLGALANCLLGAAILYLLQTFVFKKRSEETPAVPAALATSDQAQQPRPAPERSPEHEAWLATLLDKVEGNISRHAVEVDELAEELSAVSPDDPSSLMAVAAAMLLANRRLQADLANSQAEILKQRQTVDELAAESRTDGLTGLPNRRSFDEELVRRIDQWQRYKVPVALVLVDVDRLKQINDRHGRPTGDSVLKWLAGIQSKAIRPMDVAARYGGEEFGLILPGTKLSDASNVAERLRATIAGRTFAEGGCEFPVTVSIGVAVALAEDEAETLIKRADDALSAAKQNGRDRAYLHNGGEAVPIQFDKGLVRHPFDSVQQVAVYHGGMGIPPAHAFSPMRSSDISANGISLISESAPEFRAVVVRLGAGAQTRYMVANVVNVTALSDEPTQYRIGCAFVSSLEAEDDAIDATCTSTEPDLVSC